MTSSRASSSSCFLYQLSRSALPPQAGDGVGEELVPEEGEAGGHGCLYQAGRKTLIEGGRTFLSSDALHTVQESVVRPDLQRKRTCRVSCKLT